MHILIFPQKKSIKYYWSEKLPITPEAEDLLGKWDILQISTELLNLLGRIIPDGSKEKDVYVGLKVRKCLMRPYEHSEKFHKMKATATAPKAPGMM